MCGIFGYLGNIEYDRAKYCLDTLSHRGPDGDGTWHTQEIFLGHRRLAILDLTETGKQPMSYADGKYWITFNGEIYNFIEIKKELVKKGFRFVSDSDTEVILASYIAWGEKCLDRFNGMWAFAIWDEKNKELFLSRDRFGKKPLYYSWIGADMAFASEMKAIAPLMDKIEPEMDIINDVKHIFYYESTDQCLIKGIKRFPAGHYAKIKDGQMTLTRYWNTLDHLVEVPKKYEDQVEMFREIFLDACKIRMRSDVPIGTALSGGLDSSAVFCALNHISKKNTDTRVNKSWQHAFCSSFPGTPLDEAQWASKVAAYCDSKINILEIDPEKYLKDFYHHTYLLEDIYITPHIPFVANYQAMRDKGIVVTLDGHGADELFGGYSFDYLHILHDEMLNFHSAKSVIDTYYDSYIGDSDQFAKLPPKMIFYLQQAIRNSGKKILNYRNHCTDDQHPAWKKMDYFTQKLYISFHQTVLPTLLRNYDRYAMASGVEIRMPFMDHRLVSLAFSLPWQSKIRNGYSKSIIRDACSPFMPHDVAYRKTKIGFNSPLSDWLAGPFGDFIRQTLASKEFENSKLVNHDQLKPYLDNIFDNKKASFHEAESIWKSLIPFFWEKGFLAHIKRI